MNYTYDTTADEDAALAIELMKINGQLVGQGNAPVDLHGMFTLFVRDRLRPLTIQTIQSQVAPVIQKYLDGDAATRQKILDSATQP